MNSILRMREQAVEKRCSEQENEAVNDKHQRESSRNRIDDIYSEVAESQSSDHEGGKTDDEAECSRQGAEKEAFACCFRGYGIDVT